MSESTYSSSIDLHEALNKLSGHPYVRQWSPDSSVFKLLYIFCLPELDGLLNDIKLLLPRSRNVEMICLRCIDEGELAQLAALLLFSWDSLVAPFADKGIESTPIAMHIFKELIPQNLESQHLYGRELVDWKDGSVQEKKTIVIPAWNILTVLERVRDVIHSYRESGWAKHTPNYDVPYDIAHDIWRKARDDDWKLAFVPRNDVFSDDIPCLLPQVNLEDKAALNKALQSKICSEHMTDPPESGLNGTISVDGDLSDRKFPSVNVLDLLLPEDDPEYHRMYEDLLVNFIKEDNKDAFVKLINLSKHKKDTISKIPSFIFGEDAVDCFAAVLSGETDAHLTVSCLMSGDAPTGWTVLHEAAKSNATRIIALLLERGFAGDANAKSNCSELNLEQALPLDLVLANARSLYMRGWAGINFAIGLLVRLSQGDMNSVLESLRLLAPKTNDFKQVVLKYFMEWKIVEVGALLMVGYNQLLLSKPDDLSFGDYLVKRPVDDPTLPTPIRFESQSVHAQIERRQTWVLLTLFERTGDKLTAYAQLEHRLKLKPQQILVDIAALLEDARYPIRHQDAYVHDTTYRSESRDFVESFLDKICGTSSSKGIRIGGFPRPTQTLFDKQASTMSFISATPARGPMFHSHLTKRSLRSRLFSGISHPGQTFHDKQASANYLHTLSFVMSKPARDPMFDAALLKRSVGSRFFGTMLMEQDRMKCVPVCDQFISNTSEAKTVRSQVFVTVLKMGSPRPKCLPAMRLCAHILGSTRRFI